MGATPLGVACAPYRATGQLEVVGLTPAGLGYRAMTREGELPRRAAVCAACVSEGAEVRLWLVAPDGPPLSVSGTIVQSRALGVGGSEVVMVFDVEQPRRSRIRAVA